MSELIIWTLDWVPEMPRGFVRDMRLRWACEEARLDYSVRTVPFEGRETNHLDQQPFGQVPFLTDGEVEMFESGACLLHLARKSEKLMPRDPVEAAEAVEWMFAALNSVEPSIMDLSFVTLFEADKPWSTMRRPAVEERIHGRLKDLSARLGDRQWLDGDTFTAGDLLMVSVLRILINQGFVESYDNLAAYMHRGIDRPAFQRALADQLAGFTGEPPDWYAEWAAKQKQGETA